MSISDISSTMNWNNPLLIRIRHSVSYAYRVLEGRKGDYILKSPCSFFSGRANFMCIISKVISHQTSAFDITPTTAVLWTKPLPLFGREIAIPQIDCALEFIVCLPQWLIKFSTRSPVLWRSFRLQCDKALLSNKVVYHSGCLLASFEMWNVVFDLATDSTMMWLKRFNFWEKVGASFAAMDSHFKHELQT